MFDFLERMLHPVSAATPAALPVIAAKTAAVAQGTIPDDDLTFVETEEDGAPVYYAKHYENWDWPGGDSGPTAGVGYDCGYCTATEIERDWTGILPDEMVARMVGAAGIKGDAARQYVEAHRGEITVTWDQAKQEFVEREVPKWVARCEAVLPNFAKLPGDCRGALFSLSYNRGTGGYDDPGSRDYEMREIKALMASPKFAVDKAYLAPVPGYIAAMARLWPTVKDLRDRRAHEAAVFQKGIDSLTTVQASM